ncbi:hypothetical protein BKA93DRAFT_230609 [Sparassis latifolia]
MPSTISRPATYRDLFDLLGLQPPKELDINIDGTPEYLRTYCDAVSRWVPGFSDWAEESRTFHLLTLPLDYMLSVPRMLQKTPLEFAAEAYEYSRPYRKPSKSNWSAPHQVPYRPPPPPCMVRVRWYQSIEHMVPDQFEDPDLFADIPLESNGDLDMRKIKRLWNLENCYPVDWTRLKVMVPGDPDRLSSLAVEVMTRDFDRCLRVIERPGPATLLARERRVIFIDRWRTTKSVCTDISWKLRNSPRALFELLSMLVMLVVAYLALRYAIRMAVCAVVGTPHAIAVTAKAAWHYGMQNHKVVLLGIVLAFVMLDLMKQRRPISAEAIVLRIAPVVIASFIGCWC